MPALDPVPSDPTLPQQVDVVVIGGGIIGVMAAHELARKGFTVAVLEKGAVGAEQSSRNWGWCRVHGRTIGDLPLATASLRLWSGLNRLVGAETGFRHTGMLAVLHDERELAFWHEWFEQARPFQMDGRILSRDELRRMVPAAETASWAAGVFSASDGRAEPAQAAPAIARAARTLGVSVHQGCAARGLDITAGRVTGVVTEHGRIRAAAVLCAGGAWTALFCRRHGIRLPQAGVFATALRTTPGPSVIEGGINDGRYALRRREDGGYTVALGGVGRVELTPQNLRYAWDFLPLFRARRGKLSFGVGHSFLQGPEAAAGWSMDGPSPFERMRVLSPAPSAKLVKRSMQHLHADFPVLRDLRVAEAWGGLIDSTPDARPVISPVRSLPGFFLATGFSGLGFGLGPAGGRLAADLIANDTPIVDPAPYRHARFTDGSRPRPSAHM